MIRLSRRLFSGICAAASAATLAVVLTSSGIASAQGFAPAHPRTTPLRHATPAPVPAALAPAGPSPWVPLKHGPPYPGTMVLESDGSVLVHSEPPSGGSEVWYKLTPDSKGNYVDGTWSRLPLMPDRYNPLYFASAILPSGRMIVEGGEYLGGTPTWTNKGAIYNPVSNTWAAVSPPGGWANIGDAQSNVLPNGTFIMAQACQNCTSANGTLSTAQALFNETGNNWLTLPGYGKNDPNDEEFWTLLQSGKLLTVDTWATPTTELFTPNTFSWSFAGNTVASPVNTPNAEIGPSVGMPNGNVFVVGAGTSSDAAPTPCTTHTPAPTALYNAAAGTWSAGPAIPTAGGMQYDSADGPASILPDGHVLFDVSPCVFNAPLAFYQYNPGMNTVTPVPDVPNAANDSTYYTRMVALPNGQVLFNDGSSQMLVYTAGGTPNPAWAPVVASIGARTYAPGQTGTLSGYQLAGLDQGAAYGDDVQDNTNFPLVRITNSATGVVTYARTHNWTSVSVAPGSASSTKFTIPSTTPAGASTLVVVANGIASGPVPITIS